MAFLDNSGDIILDVVLTDHGRKVLARGDGTFQITKFALGDEEVDYSLYNKTHPSGSSYYDLEILQTPVLEAFTNNASSMKTRLMTFDNLEFLFLPALRLSETDAKNARHSTLDAFLIAVNADTEDDDGLTPPASQSGVGRDQDDKVVQGFILGETLQGTIIKVDQGIDTTEISSKRKLDDELKDTSFIVQMDNRLGKLVDTQGTEAAPDYIDDDNVAYYTVDLGDTFVTEILEDGTNAGEVIRGPRGTRLEFRIKASMDLNTSSFLFTQLGGTSTAANRRGGSTNLNHIDSNIRVSGVKTGTQLDIPVRYVRKQ